MTWLAMYWDLSDRSSAKTADSVEGAAELPPSELVIDTSSSIIEATMDVLFGWASWVAVRLARKTTRPLSQPQLDVKKERTHALDQESDKKKVKKKRKKTRSRPWKRPRKKKTFIFSWSFSFSSQELVFFFSYFLVFFYKFSPLCTNIHEVSLFFLSGFQTTKITKRRLRRNSKSYKKNLFFPVNHI